MKKSLIMLESKRAVPTEDVLAAVSQGRVLACDFAVTGAADWDEKPWGYERGRIVNIDHHANTPVMRRHVSSANLALKYVRESGAAKTDETVVINHTDCDSVLSAAIVLGDLEPLEIFGEASIAADHTGEENAIADLLQALDARRDYEYSLSQLRALLASGVLDDAAQTALAARREEREAAARLVREGAFTVQDGIAWAQLETRISGEFFPALLPEAKLILVFSPRPSEPGVCNNKARLGLAAPEGFSLNALLQPLDEHYGGRWNAGSNKSNGGSTLSPQEYMARVLEAQR